MNLRHFYILGFSALMLFDTWTQVAFKLAAHHAGEFALSMAWLEAALRSPWIYAAVGGYLGAFITWMTLLKHAPIGPAFAASHLEVVMVLIISVFFFDEHLAWPQVLGALCIVLGIVFLSLSEAKQPHA